MAFDRLAARRQRSNPAGDGPLRPCTAEDLGMHMYVDAVSRFAMVQHLAGGEITPCIHRLAIETYEAVICRMVE